MVVIFSIVFNLFAPLNELLQVFVYLVYLFSLLPKPDHIVDFLGSVVEFHVITLCELHAAVHGPFLYSIGGDCGGEELLDFFEVAEGNEFGVFAIVHD